MGVFAYKYLTIQAGGTPQPLIGTWLTAAVTQPQINASQPAQNNLANNVVTLTVSDTSMFASANYAVVTDPSTFVAEKVRLGAVLTTTTMTVLGLQKTHPGGAYGTGAWVGVGDLCQNIYVQAKDGNTGALFIGANPRMVTSTGLYMIAKIQSVTSGTQPYEFSTSRQGAVDTEVAGQFWIDGTTGDSYLPSLGKV